MTKDQLTTFGEMVQVLDDLAIIVRNARRTRRLSLRGLALALEMSASTICRIEEGREFSSTSLRAVLAWLDGKPAEGSTPTGDQRD